jgi:SAM-dependent methyltransferase
LKQPALPFGDEPFAPASEHELAAACGALIVGARGLSAPEAALLNRARRAAVADRQLTALSTLIAAGADPLGEAFLSLRSPKDRRADGAVYTPPAIVDSMIAWISRQAEPARLVDPGAGSGRFLANAARRFNSAQLVAVEADPLAALMLRANAAVQGWSPRLRLHVGDFRELTLPAQNGVTAFVGNPPYVRHHGISPQWKAWYREACAAFGVRASALAGLHLHFFVQALRLAKVGDIGVFITAAEWLDVNYGSALRQLLTERLGGIELRVLEPTAEAFPGTATTAAITGFRVGASAEPVRVQVIDRAADLSGSKGGIEIARDMLRSHSRWSVLVRHQRPKPAGAIELGELFRVHRGQVTGANGVWVAASGSPSVPERFKLASVTRARDLIDAGERLSSSDALRRVIELPAELDAVSIDERKAVERFLAWARSRGAHEGYVARHRRAWWSVGLREPAPILCTYMGRRPPQFTLNGCDARHINIAHGLYPRAPLTPMQLRRVARWLNQHVDVSDGRTYAGGLTKFEPKELERLQLPAIESLPA